MTIEHTTIANETPGAIARLSRESHADPVKADDRWESEQAKWDGYDGEVFGSPQTVGACVFMTQLDGHVVGLGSWDPRQGPEYGIVGHNFVLPEFRGMGSGCRQCDEILQRFESLDIRRAKVSTVDHPFFVPAQRMYAACGFGEVGRVPWDRDPGLARIEYEKELLAARKQKRGVS
ncbi:MAG: GNAT family N-acetyltransferase [Candidatus Bipolaricaulis sp.]|nr:GNAT family N-acetyltransferase [Candidatus Bipolaricaulis sp.]